MREEEDITICLTAGVEMAKGNPILDLCFVLLMNVSPIFTHKKISDSLIANCSTVFTRFFSVFDFVSREATYLQRMTIVDINMLLTLCIEKLITLQNCLGKFRQHSIFAGLKKSVMVYLEISICSCVLH